MKTAKVIQLHSNGKIGVVESLEAGEVVRMAHASGFSNVTQKNGIAFDRELSVATVMNEKLESFIADPIRVILGEAVVGEEPRQSIHLVNPAWEKKTRSLEPFESFLKEVKGARRIREQALLVADELYTNAMKVGRPHSLVAPNAVAREGTVEFFAESDGTRLIVGCRDSFGELSFSHILSRLTHCFENGLVHSIKQGKSGAGIGSFLVFNTCVGYYCGVQKGSATVVCVALPLGFADDELADLPKNIHLVSA